MKYRNIVRGRFVSRPNRFIAEVEVEMKNAEDKAGRRQEDEDGCRQKERVHVNNTGRCRELLLPGARVVLEKSDNPNRKTNYDLIAVYKRDWPGTKMEIPGRAWSTSTVRRRIKRPPNGSGL